MTWEVATMEGGVSVKVTMSVMSLNPWQRECGFHVPYSENDKGNRDRWVDPGKDIRTVHVKWPTR